MILLRHIVLTQPLGADSTAVKISMYLSAPLVVAGGGGGGGGGGESSYWGKEVQTL